MVVFEAVAVGEYASLEVVVEVEVEAEAEAEVEAESELEVETGAEVEEAFVEGKIEEPLVEAQEEVVAPPDEAEAEAGLVVALELRGQKLWELLKVPAAVETFAAWVEIVEEIVEGAGEIYFARIFVLEGDLC